MGSRWLQLYWKISKSSHELKNCLKSFVGARSRAILKEIRNTNYNLHTNSFNCSSRILDLWYFLLLSIHLQVIHSPPEMWYPKQGTVFQLKPYQCQEEQKNHPISYRNNLVYLWHLLSPLTTAWHQWLKLKLTFRPSSCCWTSRSYSSLCAFDYS